MLMHMCRACLIFFCIRMQLAPYHEDADDAWAESMLCVDFYHGIIEDVP